MLVAALARRALRALARPVISPRAGPAGTALGRWGVERDAARIAAKCDQANEDHCGCCGPSRDAPDAAAPRAPADEAYLVPFIV